jgi:hypothetical protein
MPELLNRNSPVAVCRNAIWPDRQTFNHRGAVLQALLLATVAASDAAARSRAWPPIAPRGRVLGHSLGGLMATYNVSRHRKQKMAALVAVGAELRRIVGKESVSGNVVPLRLAS